MSEKTKLELVVEALVLLKETETKLREEFDREFFYEIIEKETIYYDSDWSEEFFFDVEDEFVLHLWKNENIVILEDVDFAISYLEELAESNEDLADELIQARDCSNLKELKDNIDFFSDFDLRLRVQTTKTIDYFGIFHSENEALEFLKHHEDSYKDNYLVKKRRLRTYKS